MPDLTDVHRDLARRALVVGGYPDYSSAGERLRRSAVLEAVATAIALAEERGSTAHSTCTADGCGGQLVVADDGRWHHAGPHGAGLHRPVPADPTPAEEAAFAQGLGQAFAEALAVLEAPDPDGSIRAIAAEYGVDRDLDGPPSALAAAILAAASSGGLLDTDEPQPDEPPCSHPRGHVLGNEDGMRYCPDCGDVAVTPVPGTAADRLSWTGAEGLIITPPPADPS